MALLEQLRDEFLSKLEWSDKASEDQKQLVSGNIRSFTQFLAGRLGNAVENEPRVAAALAAGVRPDDIGDHLVLEEDHLRAATVAAASRQETGEHGYKEYTSPEVASLAARGLTNPGSLTPDEIKRVCASALTQAGGDPIPPKPQG